MSNEPESLSDKVKYNRLTNQAKSLINEIARAFVSLAFILKEIYDSKIYALKYKNFADYCEKEITSTWQTAYDYIKIANFILENKDIISEKKAEKLGYKKLKLLSQKLAKQRKEIRKLILTKIDYNDTYPVIKKKLEISLHQIKSARK